MGHAGLQCEKPGENGQVPAGMGTAKSPVWGHHIPLVPAAGGCDEAFWVQWDVRGLGEGTGLQVGRLGGFGGLCWKPCPQQEPCISPVSALSAPSPAHHYLRVLNITQPWEWTLQPGSTSPTGSIPHHSPQGPPPQRDGGALRLSASRGANSWHREHGSAGGGPVRAALAWFTHAM